jgi:hypothetical protein
MTRASTVCRTRFGRARLLLELLELRDVPSVTSAPPLDSTDVHETVMAGKPSSELPDSPTLRVDPNTATSPFAGVGSLLVTTKKTSYVGTATVIGKREIITAAHVLDLNGDGRVDQKDGITGVYFILNAGGDETSKIAVAKFDLDPNFTGFNRPAVNDDLAVLTLAEDIPDGVPIYSLPTSDLLADSVVTMVGYGRSGDGVKGYTTNVSLTVKHMGQNTVDAFYGQDDKGQPAANEVYRFDFDGPTGNGPLGGPTLGNLRETQLGTGDSGGPLFVTSSGQYLLVGVNAYVQGSNAPKFGSMGGGMNLYAYLDFINSVLGTDGGAGTSPGTGGDTPMGGTGGDGPMEPLLQVALPAPELSVAIPASQFATRSGVRIGARAISGELVEAPIAAFSVARSSANLPSFSERLSSSRGDRPVDTLASSDRGNFLQSTPDEQLLLDQLLAGKTDISIDSGLLSVTFGDDTLSVE